MGTELYGPIQGYRERACSHSTCPRIVNYTKHLHRPTEKVASFHTEAVMLQPIQQVTDCLGTAHSIFRRPAQIIAHAPPLQPERRPYRKPALTRPPVR